MDDLKLKALQNVVSVGAVSLDLLKLRRELKLYMLELEVDYTNFESNYSKLVKCQLILDKINKAINNINACYESLDSIEELF